MTALAERLGALDQVVELGRGRLPAEVVEDAERIAGKAGARLRLGVESTVVALAGTTGSGKSSLLNALAGTDVSTVGVRRPTTSTATAVVWGAGGAGELLDWLAVPARHTLPPDPGVPDGLVVLDLPDFDSVQLSNRLEADRLVELVDLLVWVLDPQKYADASLHDTYLRPLAGHADVMLVLLNQADRLPPAAVDVCVADLRTLLAGEGLGAVPVLATSARTGAGLDELRALLASRAAARRDAVRRLEADLRRTTEALRPACPPARDAGVRRADRAALVDALTDAAGASVVADAVARSHRMKAIGATGWPFSRWVRKLRPDPMRKLHLPESPSELVRTSMPPASAVARARVDTALRNLTDHATEGLPEPWPGVVRRTAVRSTAALPDLLDRTVAGTDLGVGRQPRWWMLAGFLQAVLAVAAVAGLLWLLVLLVLDWFRFPEPPTPDVGVVPLPTLLLAGGVLAGLLLALLARRLATVGARRRGVRARRRIAARVESVADEQVLAPIEAELAVHSQLCAAVDRLAA